MTPVTLAAARSRSQAVLVTGHPLEARAIRAFADLAGVYAAIVEVSVETIGALLDVNVRGPLLAAQAAIPHLPAGGRIITIGSARAERIVGDTGTIYFMTKSALHSFTRGLARERGSRDVAVNLVQRRSRSLPTKTD